MAIEPNCVWDESMLGDFLLYDFWRPQNAWLVLAGFDYSSTKHHICLLTIDQVRTLPYELYSEDVDRLRSLWQSKYQDGDMCEGETFPPSYYIEWALSKRYRPVWLDWAVERRLYSPQQIAGNISQNEKKPPYSSPWLIIQQSAIEQFFKPRRNPDAKRDAVVEWIKQQAETAGLPDSNNIAAAIFTIIKPTNHDPKKKRIEPLE
jgi:hypothetical protein